MTIDDCFFESLSIIHTNGCAKQTMIFIKNDLTIDLYFFYHNDKNISVLKKKKQLENKG